MNILDKRLYQARNLQDFAFRWGYRDEDNKTRRNATREAFFYVAGGFVAPDTNRIWGVDVSHWDGNVDFTKTTEYGAKFAVIKAIDGTVTNQYYKANNRRAYDAGLLNGAYGWLYPDKYVSCKAQAQAYWNFIKDEPMRLPPTIDFEWTRYAGQQANPDYDDLRKWLTEFVRVAKKPILYSAAGYMNMFGKLPADIREMLDGEWWASYGGVNPIYPMGFSAPFDMWQFSANGDAMLLCPGDTGKKELDLNYMSEEFYRRYVGDISEPPDTGDTMVIIRGTAIGNVVRRKAPAGEGFSPARYLFVNDAIEADRHEFQWLHLTKINGVAVVGDEWVSAGSQQQYIRWEEVDVPDEPDPEPPAEVTPPDEIIAKWNATATRPAIEKRYLPE